jgi:hypothetical protein
LGITIIMKRIHISFIDSSQRWLFYSYVEQAAPISTMIDENFRPRDGAAPIVPDSDRVMDDVPKPLLNLTWTNPCPASRSCEMMELRLSE